MSTSLYRVLLLASGLGLFACSSSSPPPKEPEKCKQQILSSAIIASPHINPSSEGEPRPVQVRLYQLKTDTKLLNSSFEQVWQDDKTALGDSLGKVEEFTVYPNTRTEVKFERDESAQFMVAAALFREPKGRTWHVSFELPPPPSAGSCGAKCAGGECDAGAANPNPKMFIWIDGSAIADGSDHADDYPDGRVHAAGVSTPSSDCGPGAKDNAPSQPNADGKGFDPSNLSMPEMPSAPSGPDLPIAPKAPTAPKAPSVPKAPSPPTL